MTEKYAAVDIGSNSCLLLIVEKFSDSEARVLVDTKLSTRVSSDVAKQGAIGKAAAEVLYTALEQLHNKIQEHKIDQVRAVGTQVFRFADNGKKIAEQIKERFGWDIQIISGEEEARLSYLAATDGLSDMPERRVVADVGGGSTEIVIGTGSNTDFLHSFPVGAVTLTENFSLNESASDYQIAAADGYLSALLMGEESGLPDLEDAESCELVVTGGTIATLGGAYHKLTQFDPVKIHGTRLKADWIEQMTSVFKAEAVEQRRQHIPFDPDRAEIILAGTLLVRWLLNWSSRKSVIVSNRGLRWGVLRSGFAQLSSIEIKQ